MKKLLFIGNSHTYFNDMPHMASEIFRIYDNEDVFVTMLTQGGMSLDWHSKQEQTIFNIKYGGYDYVILQQFTHPFGGKETLIEGAQKLLPAIRESKAIPVAYMTWAAKDKPSDQAELTDAFIALAEQENTLLARAGDFFQKVIANTEYELYYTDGRHAGPLGSYIAALSIYMAITKKDVPDFKEDEFYEKNKLYDVACREFHRIIKEK